MLRYPRLTVTDREAGTVHYDSDATAIIVVVTAHDYPQRVAFKCIADIKQRFLASFGEALHKSAEGGLSKAARPLLSETCAQYSDAARVDKTTHLLREVTEVKGIVQDSLSDMLATRENLEVLEDKTVQLRSEAANFQRKAVDLRRTMWWRNCKLKLLLAVVITVVLAYILVPILVNAMGD